MTPEQRARLVGEPLVAAPNTIAPDRIGGLPRYVRELASALAGAGCETVLLAKRVCARSPRVEPAPDGVRILRHPGMARPGPRAYAPAMAGSPSPAESVSVGSCGSASGSSATRAGSFSVPATSSSEACCAVLGRKPDRIPK